MPLDRPSVRRGDIPERDVVDSPADQLDLTEDGGHGFVKQLRRESRRPRIAATRD